MVASDRSRMSGHDQLAAGSDGSDAGSRARGGGAGGQLLTARVSTRGSPPKDLALDAEKDDRDQGSHRRAVGQDARAPPLERVHGPRVVGGGRGGPRQDHPTAAYRSRTEPGADGKRSPRSARRPAGCGGSRTHESRTGREIAAPTRENAGYVVSRPPETGAEECAGRSRSATRIKGRESAPTARYSRDGDAVDFVADRATSRPVQARNLSLGGADH